MHQTLADIGYIDARTGIDPRRCRVQIAFDHPVREIGLTAGSAPANRA